MKKILILDSDEQIVNELEQVLWDNHHVITKTRTANLAEVYHQLMPDVIIIADVFSDWQEQGLAAMLKPKYHDTLPPFIILSGADDVHLLAAEMNAAGYLRKPITVGEVNDIIENVLMGDIAGGENGEFSLSDSR